MLLAVVVGVLFFDPTGVGAVIFARLSVAAVAWELAKLINASAWITLLLSQVVIRERFGLEHPGYLVAFLILGIVTVLIPRRFDSGNETGTEPVIQFLNVIYAKPFIVGTGSAMLLLVTLKSHFPPVLVAAVPIWAGDTAAIFAGKAFGKHKLAPSISPNKTWEGSIANLLAAVGAAAALGYFLRYPMDKMLLLGVSCGVIGQLGDLFESYLKRQAEVKDSGNLLPGHGGVFDRLDSLLMTAPFSYWILSSFLK